MKQRNLERAIVFAKGHGYETAEYLNEWRGYFCYEPIWSIEEAEAGEYRCVGLPFIIMIKSAEIRWSSVEETFEHLDETAQEP